MHQHFWIHAGCLELVKCHSLDSLTPTSKHLTRVPKLKTWLLEAHSVFMGERLACPESKSFPVGATLKGFQVNGLQTQSFSCVPKGLLYECRPGYSIHVLKAMLKNGQEEA